jgi:YebC/PmpR family DNA-binding regulatory protein
MSGHSKWATIKRKKAKIDSARAVVFQKYSRELMVSARLGGGDPSSNFRLRTAIDRAKTAGLPADNIKRAIDKGAGMGSGDNFEELTYEGYAAGGVAVFIEAMTDNRNRTAGDIRSYFIKFNGNLGENGCVGWMFKQVGLIFF